MSSKAIVETLKELARIAIFGAVSAVISWETTQVANLDPNSAYTVIITLLLRAADKYIHANKNVSAKGLLPF